jgi:hypothetical protein
LSQIGRRYGLSGQRERGVTCDATGVFVGAVQLLEQSHEPKGLKQWRPHFVADINRDLSRRYGLPVDFSPKIEGLAAIARALDRGDVLHAQIATLHLRMPDPPPAAKAAQPTTEIVALAKELRASGLLKADWDPSKHPRWAAGSPDSVGGQFAPAGGNSGDFNTKTPDPAVIPAQITIPAPFGFALPRGIPFPSEIGPAPLIPNINPRDLLRNPYPDRPECEEEWAQARAYCDDLEKRGLLGVGDYRGMGRTFRNCVMSSFRRLRRKSNRMTMPFR